MTIVSHSDREPTNVGSMVAANDVGCVFGVSKTWPLCRASQPTKTAGMEGVSACNLFQSAIGSLNFHSPGCVLSACFFSCYFMCLLRFVFIFLFGSR